MEQEPKLRFRIAVRYESDHPIEAHSTQEAIQIWQEEMGIKQLPYKIQEEEWIKGGFRIVLELQEHLSQRDRDTLGESISIEDINKAGDDISGKPIQ